MSNKIPKPSQTLITAVIALLKARAGVETLRPVILKIRTDILDREGFTYQDVFDLEPNRLTDFEMAYLLKQEDSDRLFKIYDEALTQNGFTEREPGHCPLLEFEHLVIQAENCLLEASQELHQFFDVQEVKGLERSMQKQYIELIIKFVLPFIPKEELKV